MDILRNELNGIYASQALNCECLPEDVVMVTCQRAACLAGITDGCAVVTDVACDRCYVYSGNFGVLIGYADSASHAFVADSSDEDAIYEHIHPEDLVDKRLLEYEFFKTVDGKNPDDKTGFIARCRIRMRDRNGEYHAVENTTQLIRLSPLGKMWLILCTYCLSSYPAEEDGIAPSIVNTRTGEVKPLYFENRRTEILSGREKEVLMLIRDGKPSKQIASILGISIHTVNRHRQNIIEKLSVGNSIEAVTAATLMKLL